MLFPSKTPDSQGKPGQDVLRSASPAPSSPSAHRALFPQEQMAKPHRVTKGGVGYGVDETQKVEARRVAK